jgi:hypothetical protein
MKEFDLKLLQNLINKEIDVLNLKYIFIFIMLNLLIAIINWIFQSNIKSAENEIYRKKVREDRRILIIETIYKNLVEFTFLFTQQELINDIQKLSNIEKNISENKLYINKSLHNKLISYIDYIKEITTDFRKKDFKKESDLLNNIEVEFNK